MILLFTLASIWLLFAGLGVYVAAQKGRSAVEGAALGLLFGPLGCLIVALLPSGSARAAEPGDDDDDDEQDDAGARAFLLPIARPDKRYPDGVLDGVKRGMAAKPKPAAPVDPIGGLGIKT